MCRLITADCAVNCLPFAVKANHNHRMNYGDCKYIWQAPDWPHWHYDLAALAGPMVEVSRAQGLLLGRLADVGTLLRDQASLLALTEDVVKTSEIEGEQLNVASVRSSIARRLGVDVRWLLWIVTSRAWSRWCWMRRQTVWRRCHRTAYLDGMQRCFRLVIPGFPRFR